MNGVPEEFRRKLTSFGRRKGKTLRTHHRGLMDNELPRFEIAPEALRDNVYAPFGRTFNELWLEVGFGGGEHLAADAKLHGDVAFIGCEPFQNGVAKLLALIEERGLENVRIYPGDAREIMTALPPQSVSRVNILYPDPWPKLRQKKRRFVSDENIAALGRIMKPGAVLRFATDIDDYSAWALARIMRSRLFDWPAASDREWLSPWDGWTSTRYEQKAIREGRKPVYLTFIRTNSAS
jgi:tRNA (guanine-N7-)-methyltransferase